MDQIITTLKDEKEEIMEEIKEKETRIPKMCTAQKEKSMQEEVEDAWFKYYQEIEEQK